MAGNLVCIVLLTREHDTNVLTGQRAWHRPCVQQAVSLQDTPMLFWSLHIYNYVQEKKARFQNSTPPPPPEPLGWLLSVLPQPYRIIMCVYLRQCSVHRLFLLFGLCPPPPPQVKLNDIHFCQTSNRSTSSSHRPPTWPYKFLHLDHCSGNTLSLNCMTETVLRLYTSGSGNPKLQVKYDGHSEVSSNKVNVQVQAGSPWPRTAL